MSAAPTTLAASPERAIARPVDDFISVSDLVRRVNIVREVFDKVMKEETHWGTIPGCKQPSLYKPGAELVCSMFRLVPEYETETSEMPGGHREVRVKCILKSVSTGAAWGQGLGVCSTMESKYRYVGSMGEPTGRSVPRAYWDAKRAGDSAGMAKAIGGREFFVKKNDGNWEVFKKSAEKEERIDMADVYHTVSAMAAKRAYIAATRSSTPAGEMFGQEIDPDDVLDDGPAQAPAEPAAAAAAPAPEQKKAAPKGKPTPADLQNQINEAEHRNGGPPETDPLRECKKLLGQISKLPSTQEMVGKAVFSGDVGWRQSTDAAATAKALTRLQQVVAMAERAKPTTTDEWASLVNEAIELEAVS